MNASIKLFRALIIFSVVTGFGAGFIDQNIAGLVPDALLQAHKAALDATRPSLFVSLLALFVLGGTLAATVGLYLFKPWAREAALAMTLLSWLFYPMMGVSMHSGLALMLVDMASTSWGALLAISFVSSLSTHFRERAQ